jgi:hypothetical protein
LRRTRRISKGGAGDGRINTTVDAGRSSATGMSL